MRRFLLPLAVWLCLTAGVWAAEGRPLDIAVQPASYGTAFFQAEADTWARSKGGTGVLIQGDPRVHDKVRIRVMAGDFPDATDAQLEYDTLIGAGRILDLTPYLEGPNWEGTGRWRDDFLPGILDRWTREGRVYGLPYAFAVWVLFYDEARFSQAGWTPPRTWEEFFALAPEMRKRGLAPLALPGVYLRYADALLRAGYFQLAGPDAYRGYQTLEEGTFVSKEWLQTSATLARVGREALLPGWEGMTHTAAQQAFLDGRAAMALSASWLASEMRGKIPSGVRLAATPLPAEAEVGDRAGAMQVQAAYYFLFRSGDSERERATVDYFRYLTSRTVATRFAREVKAQVALRTVGPDAYDEPVLQSLARLMQAAPAVYDAAPPPTSAFQAFYLGGLNEHRYALVKGALAPEEFGRRLEASAAAERQRLREPEAVQMRHGGRAGLLGLAVAGLLAIGWVAKPFRKKTPAAAGGLPRGVAWRYLGPGFGLFAAFVLLPGVASFFWALTHWDGFGGLSWAGLFNFRWLLLESDTFWRALANNLFLMVVPTLAIVPTALLLATLLHRGTVGAAFFRAVILFPNLLGGIAAALLWMNAFDPHRGLVNAALAGLGDTLGSEWLRSFAGYAWLSPDHLYLALVPVYLWMAVGFNTVLYLGAMQAIDRDLYEAAEIDGAGPLAQFFRLTLPLIADTLSVSAVFIVVAGLNTFEMVWLMTSQEPTSSSHVLSTFMVSTLFREFDVGRATAVAVVMFALVFAASWAVRRAAEGRAAR